MSSKKTKVRARSIRLKVYDLFEQAVESGVAYGYNRAHKHTERPSEETIKNEIIRSVMSSLDELIVWDDRFGDDDE